MRWIISGVILSFGLILGGCTNSEEVKEGQITRIDKDKHDFENYEEIAEDYKETEGITLESKEIEVDMANNLDKHFLIAGYGQLSSYFNYGFTNESKLFSVKVKPLDGGNHWYVYFNRDVFGELFEELNQNKSTYATVYIDALIPKSAYITGQGNLATEHLNFKAKKGV